MSNLFEVVLGAVLAVAGVVITVAVIMSHIGG